MTDDLLRIEEDGPVLVATITRPAALNALDGPTLDALAALVDRVRTDTAVRAVVLTGAGDRAFVAGADIRELSTLTPATARTFAARGQQVFDGLEQSGTPVIAAVNGVALGGGCELAMACTLRIAADTAQFAQPEVDLGLTPGFGGTQRLARLVGRGRALELLLTGRRIGAAEAERIGLVNRVVPAADLLTEATRLARELASKAPMAVRYILAAVHEGDGMPLEMAERTEAAYFGLVAATDDMREGTRAFLEKRTPVFAGK